MPSIANPRNEDTNSQVLMHDMLEIIRDMRDLLREGHKEHGESETLKAAPLTGSGLPSHEDERVTEKDSVQVAEENRPDRSTKPTIPKRFGMKKEHIQRTNPVAANYNYCQKYPEDRQYYEHDSEARVWWVYLDEATAFDNDMIDELGDSLDILLVFAGLFSAVVTTFVTQTSQALSINYASLSASYLGEISIILRASGNSSSISQIPLTDTTFSPNAGDIWVNGLWFTSLTIALSVALFAVLAKQWLRQYMSIVTGTPRERTFIRQFRFDGLKAWRVQAIIGILPVILHLSLVLFLIGLVVFLVPLNVAIASVTGVITVSIVLLYLAASVLPLCVVQCPYRTTFSDLLYYISQLPRVAYQRFQLPWHLRWLPEGHSGHFTVLKDVERCAACRIKGDHEELILKALWWLGEYTSNVSAKEILLCSLGAFTPRMSNKLCTPEALRVLYGCETYSDLVDHVLCNIEAPWELVFRSMIHLSGSMLKFMEAERWKEKILGSLLTSSDIHTALAFCASDAPIDFVPIGLHACDGTLRPSEGLSWLVDNYKADTPTPLYLPPLVWMGLFKASSNVKFRKVFAENFPNSLQSQISCPILCPVPIELLLELAEEGNNVPTANMAGARGSDEPLNDSSTRKESSSGMKIEVRME
ncbi:hypothetical protein FB446DRAFT_740871 [Lentinula raphanica]|nr:hypothetical protein FB446DRAFT_740871 [Lentinula raphanica]